MINPKWYDWSGIKRSKNHRSAFIWSQYGKLKASFTIFITLHLRNKLSIFDWNLWYWQWLCKWSNPRKWSTNVSNGILLTKLFWPNVRKNCHGDREKLLKFKADEIFASNISPKQIIIGKLVTGCFVTKIVLTYCEKKKFWWSRKTFEIRGRMLRIFKILRSLEQFIQAVKGQNNFGNRMLL
jgi:hypothetical protein